MCTRYSRASIPPLSPPPAPRFPLPPPPTPPQSHGTTRIRRLREAEKALDEYTERSEERRAKDAYLEHLQGEVRAVFADDTKSCAYLSFRHKGIDRSGHWENDRRYSVAASKGSFERDVWKRYTFAREMAADGDVPQYLKDSKLAAGSEEWSYGPPIGNTWTAKSEAAAERRLKAQVEAALEFGS